MTYFSGYSGTAYQQATAYWQDQQARRASNSSSSGSSGGSSSSGSYVDTTSWGAQKTTLPGGGISLGSAAGSGEITGTDYDDYLRPGFDSCTIISGDGDDTIEAYANNNLILAGKGNDSISVQADYLLGFSTYRDKYEGSKNIICYGSGDGDDTILGFGETDTLSIEGNAYSTLASGNDIIVSVDGGSMILVDAASLDAVNIEFTPTETPASSYVYTGGNQTISSYAGEPIFLGAFPTGLNFTDDDFHFYSSTGELLIEDVEDIVIDLRDGNGNAFAKAYAADDPGTIDGRNLSGFEFIVGSDDGSNVIFAGNDGSNLWGNTGNATDVLIGGAGYDTFFTGKYEGNDAIQNASSADSVNLYDVTLSDISFAAEDNGILGIAFNTGNVITIQSTDYISAKINLADGSSYRYNHATKSWQNA